MAYASLMGVRVKRKEDPRLITGVATYVGDMTLPGMRHVAFVRSPYAHANIRGIDIAAARAHPGVFAVVTGADLAPLCEPMPVATSGESGSSDTIFRSLPPIKKKGKKNSRFIWRLFFVIFMVVSWIIKRDFTIEIIFLQGAFAACCFNEDRL